MRTLAWVIAVLALAGCGEGGHGGAQKPQAPAASVPAVASAPQWDIQVQGSANTLVAVSDLTGWLVEHGFISYVVTEGGKQRVLVGPFGSRAEAQARQEQLSAALARAKKMNIESMVIEHPLAQ